MNEASVLLKIENKIAIITINNEASYNALSEAVRDDLLGILGRLANDRDVRVVVLTGAGNKAFSAGLDLKELSIKGSIGAGSSANEPSLGVNSPMVKAFANLPQPTIAAVNGVAVTGGFELALACDFLVCSENAQFADTHALVGLLPGWGLSQKLPQLIGINRAKELSFTGRYIGAQEALDLGLVNHVFSSELLLDETIKIASRIAITDPNALPRIKQMINQGSLMTMGEALQMEGERAQAYNDALDFSYLEQRLQELRAMAKN